MLERVVFDLSHVMMSTRRRRRRIMCTWIMAWVSLIVFIAWEMLRKMTNLLFLPPNRVGNKCNCSQDYATSANTQWLKVWTKFVRSSYLPFRLWNCPPSFSSHQISVLREVRWGVTVRFTLSLRFQITKSIAECSCSRSCPFPWG